MTRRAIGIALLTAVVLGCGGAAVRHWWAHREGAIAHDRNGKPLSCIRDLTLGSGHTCVLFENGRVHCYGHSQALGNGRYEKVVTTEGVVPEQGPVKTSARFSMIQASGDETCGLSKIDSSVWCWGTRVGSAFKQGLALYPAEYGALGRDNVELGLGADRVCVLKKDTSVWCERLSTGPAEEVLRGAQSLYVRNYFACAKMSDGTLQCWGSNLNGELGRGTVSDSNAGEWSEAPGPVLLGDTRVEQVRLAAVAACGLTRELTIWCWGAADFSLFADGRYERSEEPDPAVIQTRPKKLDIPVRIRDLVLGTTTACVIAEDRSVWCWGGAGSNDMLGKPSVEFKRGDALVSLEPRPRKLEPLGNDNARIWAGGAHYCVQKLDRSVWCWGSNVDREVDRDLRDSTAPLTRLPIVCPEP